MIEGTDKLILESDKVRLEPLDRKHVPALIQAAGGARDTFTLTMVPKDGDQMVKYVEAAMRARSESEAVPFATVRKDTGEVVGTTRFGTLERWSWTFMEKADPHRIPDAAEIGWTWLAPSAQRSFVNTHQKYLMLRFAFEEWKLYRITLKTDRRNERSRKAMERIGAKLDGVLRSHMPAYDGGVRDSAYYSITREDWPEVKQRLERLLER